MADTSLGTKGLTLAIEVYLVVLVLKLLVYAASGVLAILAEALHTLGDIVVSAFLLAAMVFSRRAADEGHMFGHGRAENVGALVAAVLFISFTSYKLYEEAIPRLFHPAAPSYENLPIAVGVLLLSMAIAAVPLVRFLRQKDRGPSERAQLRELVNDQLGLLAALLGTVFVAEGIPLADPVAAIVVATIIAYGAVGLFRENADYLLGRSPGPSFMASVEGLARSVDGVLGVRSIRAEFVGPGKVHAVVRIEVARGTPIERVDAIIDEIETRVAREVDCEDCTVHAEPARGGAR